MWYELKDNKWTPKPKKRKEEESASKEKAPSRSGSAKKSLAPKFEVFEMRDFMAQMLDSMQKLHAKVDNVAARLLFVKKKMREMKKEMNLLRRGKEEWEEEEEEEEEENSEEKGRDKEKEVEQEAEEEKKRVD